MEVLCTSGDEVILNVERGRELVGALTDVCVREGIDGGWIQVLGAANRITLGWFDLEKKQFNKKTFENSNMEVLHAIGNIAVLDGKPVIHLHGSFGLSDFSTVGGHLFELVVSVFCEVKLTKMKPGLRRIPDSYSGLNGLCSWQRSV